MGGFIVSVCACNTMNHSPYDYMRHKYSDCVHKMRPRDELGGLYSKLQNYGKCNNDKHYRKSF